MPKLDPRLRAALRGTPSFALEMFDNVGLESDDNGTPLVEVLVRCAPDIDPGDLAAEGMEVRFVTRGPETVVSGQTTPEGAARIADLPSVRRVESSCEMVPELDVSREEIRADRLHSAIPSVRGASTIVGVIDSGIDYTHPDFCDAAGRSRILFLWDQRAPSAPGGSVPYGREYTKADIDAALSAPNPYALVPHRDTQGHGTHVMGIAAGNGTGSAVLTGIAPDADLIVVATGGDPGGVTLGRSVRAFEAFAYIVRKAGDTPVAINMSQGMNGGGHMGETVLETGIDNLARNRGVVIVKSAGNEGTWRIHASGTVATGATAQLGITVNTNNRFDDVIELWYAGDDRLGVAVRPPGGTSLPFVAPGASATQTTQGGNSVTIDSELDADDTGHNRVTVILSAGTAAFIQPGTWQLIVRGDTVGDGSFDAWIERTIRTGTGSEQSQFTTASADLARTISIPGTARRIITVGSYATNPDGGVAGGISNFSSRGPTRSGRRKPEIAAPGEWIMSAASVTRSGATGTYVRNLGTSMAAPHVAGAAALLLEVRRDLTSEQAKQLLTRAARRDLFAATVPDDVWGAGKLDVNAAVDLARTVVFPQITGVTVSGDTLLVSTASDTTCAVRYHTHLRRLALGMPLGSVVSLNFATTHTLSLAGLAAGLYFCEVVVFDRDNWWTEDDNGGAGHEVTV